MEAWIAAAGVGAPLEVSLQSFACNNVPVSECPLDLTPRGTIECSSASLTLYDGQTGDISGIENTDSSCSRSFFSPSHLWSYEIQLVANGGIHRPDPQLQMDRKFPLTTKVVFASRITVLLGGLIWWWMRSRGPLDAR